MIKILIADKLNSRTIDRLNEIPEFEISEKTNISQEKLATEIKNVDAVIVSGTTLLTSAMLKDSVNLKIIVLTGVGSNQVDTAMASRKKIEIRNAPLAKNRDREELAVIAILKDFFNV